MPTQDKLTARETWWNDFRSEFHELCSGQVDAEWLAGLAAALYPLSKDREAREAARVAFVTLGYELPGTELEGSAIPAPRLAPGQH
ncbi:hypothetical protein J2W28_000974 [Variovorax boronicumulans]|uniref:hypothetical protein n=1 Tax=Variovorax boronicumulans TaxID=436515 RepID=UPI002785484A|nr:hypothetical protein [Variovorax boronicumulans]MDP9991946.1 hypothetical protein [Variovorax boronicumulans]MDQ0001841.1 hypothetical protein [Variovorax boronicumulans]